MIVSVCGYMYSGSSAVMDLLKEYEETHVISDPEWYLIDQPDGLRDLGQHIMGTGTYLNTDVAIGRFIDFVESHDDYERSCNGQFKKLSYEFIDNFITTTWEGRSSLDYYRLDHFKKCIFKFNNYFMIFLKKVFNVFFPTNLRTMYLHKDSPEFYSIAQKYIEELIYSTGGSPQKVNVAKHIFATNNPEADFPFVKDPWAIVVDRDPRDIFIEGNRDYEMFFPTQDVEKFVLYYKFWRRNPRSNSDRILWMNFEDLVYNYDFQVGKIEQFLNISKHFDGNKYFDPNKSKNNTRLYVDNKQYRKEINYIEKELKEYLWTE